MVKPLLALTFLICSFFAIGQHQNPNREHRESILQFGRLYDAYFPAVGHQFFGSKLPSWGSIVYDGVQLDSLKLNYDVYQNLLIYYRRNTNSTMTPLLPNQSIISEFRMGSIVFRKVTNVKELDQSVFYQLLFENQDFLFLKWVKKDLLLNQDPIAANKFIFKDESELVLVFSGHVIPIKNPRKIQKELKSLDSKFESVFDQKKLNKANLIEDTQAALVKYSNL